jgi:hypothetical protein
MRQLQNCKNSNLILSWIPFWPLFWGWAIPTEKKHNWEKRMMMILEDSWSFVGSAYITRVSILSLITDRHCSFLHMWIFSECNQGLIAICPPTHQNKICLIQAGGLDIWSSGKGERWSTCLVHCYHAFPDRVPSDHCPPWSLSLYCIACSSFVGFLDRACNLSQHHFMTFASKYFRAFDIWWLINHTKYPHVMLVSCPNSRQRQWVWGGVCVGGGRPLQPFSKF